MSLLNDNDVSPEKITPSHSLESLSIEVELQLLLDKVTTLEANYNQILRNQDEILSRLAALENQSTRQQDTLYNTSFLSFNETDGFFFNQPPMYIPLPPLHPPRSLSLDEHWSAKNQTPTREYRAQRRTPIHPHPAKFIASSSAGSTPAAFIPANSSTPAAFIRVSSFTSAGSTPAWSYTESDSVER